MAEVLTLTAPVTFPNLTGYTITDVQLDITNLTVRVRLVGDNGRTFVRAWTPTTSPTGATVLHALNTGNFSTNSLSKKIYQQLITDGLLAGTISGTPL